jgi:DNA replication protein DnaC
MLEKENFKTFSLEYYSDQDIDPQSGISALEYAKRAESRCFQFARTFDHHYENLLLQGDTGTGKTFLTHCVAKELLDTGHSVIYLTAHKLFDLLAKNAFRKDIQNLPEYQNIFSCDLLIIDDLGTELPNALTVSLFFDCLNDRLLAGKSTLISTNLDLSDIREIYSERVSSRIFEHFRQIHLYGDDIRIRKKTL